MISEKSSHIMERVKQGGPAVSDATTASYGKLINIKRLCGLLGISPAQGYRLLRSGKILKPCTRLGRSQRWREQEVVDWINAGCPDRLVWTWEYSGKVGCSGNGK